MTSPSKLEAFCRDPKLGRLDFDQAPCIFAMAERVMGLPFVCGWAKLDPGRMVQGQAAAFAAGERFMHRFTIAKIVGIDTVRHNERDHPGHGPLDRSPVLSAPCEEGSW